MSEGMASAAVVATGTFRDADSFHKGSGQATVYDLGAEQHVLRLEEFRVTNGPDLHVLLSVHPDPATRSEVMDQGYLELGKLKGNLGNHNYEVPSGTEATRYRSVVIYCKPFHVIFSVASLTPLVGS